MPTKTTIANEQTTLPLEQSANKRHRPWWQKAIEASAIACVAVIALEGFFQLNGIGQQEFLEPDLQLGCRHIPNKVVTWRLEGYSNDKLSSVGLRDTEHAIAKPAGVTRIALLGDSSTEGMQVSMPETYGKVLEKSLNEKAGSAKFEVINFACSSYSTGQQLLQYERAVRQYKPDIVLLLYNRGDSVENVFIPGAKALSAPRPYFYLDQTGQIQTDENVLKACSSKLKPSPLLNFLRRNSRIYGVITGTTLVLSLNESNYRKLSDWWGMLSNLWTKNDGPSTWVVPYAKQEPFKVTEALIDKLRHEVNQDGAKFILVTFPNSISDIEYANQCNTLEGSSIKEHYAFIDLSGPFFKNKDMKSLFLEYHFSAAGHKVVADLVEPLIMKLNATK